MSQGLITRIRKLEAARHSDGEILLLWRSPGKDVARAANAAKNAGLFASGDRHQRRMAGCRSHAGPAGGEDRVLRLSHL
jgi:hypothetical protein